MNPMKMLATTALGLALAMPAAAMTVDFSESTADMALFSAVVDAGSLLAFEWSDSPVSGYFRFTTSQSFDVYLQDFTPTADHGNVTGLVFYDVDASQRLTSQGDFCRHSALAVVAGDCDLIAGSDANSSNARHKPSANLDTGSLFGRLEAGSYVVGLFEGGQPSAGSADVLIVESQAPAPVPVPAAGLLLAGGIAVFGMLKRRR